MPWVIVFFSTGAIDEVLQILDDNAMNLQSMSASRFVGPFLASVQNWEKGLSLIAEVSQKFFKSDTII